jgi:hypothetical protein
MAGITPDEAQAYLARWRLFRDFEAAELQRTPMETKLRQLAALMASRDLFGPEPDRDTQVRDIRERWVRLRRTLGG